jgi:predicted ATP-binding protein involved in virulence
VPITAHHRSEFERLVTVVKWTFASRKKIGQVYFASRWSSYPPINESNIFIANGYKTMKVTKLHAENVHGYLSIDVTFFDDLTFLTGLNGSGKTSALRLLMALLTPNINELGAISFSLAEVTIADNNKEIVVSATKNNEGVELRISGSDETLRISRSELELFLETKRIEESRPQIREMYQSNPVFQAISRMSTPMFLGLDRRFFVPGSMTDDLDDIRRREYMARRFWPEDPAFKGSAAVASLIEVNYLVVTRMQEIRAAQEHLDEKLRGQFFTKAFEYKPSDILGKGVKFPSRTELSQYRQQLTKIEQAAEGVRIPMPEIQTALTHFFERMSQVVESLDKSANAKKAKKESKRGVEKEKEEMPFDKDHLEWLINRPQADRILEHLGMLNEYIENRTSLRDPIARFRSLVNEFLAQTHKEVNVGSNGQLTVLVSGNPEQRPISALSSGERQLLVILAHLSLNPNLAVSGVFIVDEPELSLHIDWQEKFVDAVREANPKVQLILATHSPAIILDRVDACRTLSEIQDA